MRSELNSKEEVIAHKGPIVCLHAKDGDGVFICVQQCVERVQRAACFAPPQCWHRCQKKKSVISQQTNKQTRVKGGGAEGRRLSPEEESHD